MVEIKLDDVYGIKPNMLLAVNGEVYLVDSVCEESNTVKLKDVFGKDPDVANVLKHLSASENLEDLVGKTALIKRKT